MDHTLIMFNLAVTASPILFFNIVTAVKFIIVASFTIGINLTVAANFATITGSPLPAVSMESATDGILATTFFDLRADRSPHGNLSSRSLFDYGLSRQVGKMSRRREGQQRRVRCCVPQNATVRLLALLVVVGIFGCIIIRFTVTVRSDATRHQGASHRQ